MFKVINDLNRPIMFTISPKESLRLLAYESKKVSKVTSEMKNSDYLRVIEIEKPKKVTKKKSKKKEE